MTTPDPNVCPQCGGRKRPEFDLCYNCSQARRGGGRKTQPSAGRALPQECVFNTFYGEDGKLRREIFLESAEKAARLFEEQKMSQASIRSLFQMLKSLEQRLKVDKDMSVGELNEVFFRFIRQVEYQAKREVIPEVFRQFVDQHKDVVIGDIREFKGFVEYLTSIVARMKTK